MHQHLVNNFMNLNLFYFAYLLIRNRENVRALRVLHPLRSCVLFCVSLQWNASFNDVTARALKVT